MLLPRQNKLGELRFVVEASKKIHDGNPKVGAGQSRFQPPRFQTRSHLTRFACQTPTHSAQAICLCCLDPTMHPTSRLLQLSCRITLFTRQNCGLCTKAKSVLSELWNRRPFEFKEIDIIKPESKPWRDLYEFDVPVVSLAQGNH